MTCPNCAGNGCSSCQQAATGANYAQPTKCPYCGVKGLCACDTFPQGSPPKASCPQLRTLPASVKVGPLVYKVEVSSYADGDHNWGECDHTNRVIRIGELTARRPEQTALTFLHEILHIVDADRKLGLSEDAISSLSNGLGDALQQLGFYPKELAP